MARKSQATIILIMGVALIIVVGIVLFTINSKISKKTETETEQGFTTMQDVNPIIHHITACVQSLSGEALDLLGTQGGYIYQSQGGIFPDPQEFQEGILYYPFQGHKVSYGISSQKALLPNYPTSASPYGSYPRAPASSGIVTYPSINGSSSSLSYQIESYITSHIDGCIESAKFDAQGYSFKGDKKNAEALLGATDIVITLSYPLEIINNITRERASVEIFQASHNIRILNIHSILTSILARDVEDLTYDLYSDSNLPSEMSLAVIKENGRSDDLIIITDTASTLQGKPYALKASRHNRNPALHYLSRNSSFSYVQQSSQTTLNFSHSTQITKELLDPYLGNPRADDPDEDNLSFTYSVQSMTQKPQLPQILSTPQMTIRITVSDGTLTDYQDITIIRNQFS